MKYFRNPEIKIELLTYGAVWGLGMILSGLAGGTSSLVAVAVTGALFALLHFISSFFRYRRIDNMSQEIDRFLHGYTVLQINTQQEGELSVLESEVSKLILRLKNQADMLKKDKIYLSDSIADISHQIRTPLTSINLIVSRLSSQELTIDKRKQLLMELDVLLAHIDWLIQSLLKISKLDAGTVNLKSERVQVSLLIQEAIEPLEIPLDIRSQTTVVECGKEVSYTGDRAWMREALSNIIKNCMEHTPEGGTIWIKAQENAIYTEIVVRDNGPGISKKDLPHLFERFYKGENSSEKSVGIGLALARMIIVSQKGTVSAENHKEGGAQFTIRFYKSTV